jgi:hypothetical protein
LTTVLHFGSKGFNLTLRYLVLTHLSPQKFASNASNDCLLYDPGGREHINIAKPVFRSGEVFHLHQTQLHQRFQVVNPVADADTELLDQFAPGEVGVILSRRASI